MTRSICPAYSLVDVRKGTNWSPSLRSVFSLGPPKESMVSDFRILRKEASLPAEI